MASQPPENEVNTEDNAEFEAAFAEFAGTKTAPLPSEQEPEKASPEASTPEARQGEEQAPPHQAEASPPPSGQQPGGEQQPPPEEQQPDPLASLSPEAKAVVDELRREKERAEHQARSDAARVAALSRKIATLTTGASRQQPEAPADGKDGKNVASAEIEPVLKKLEEELPEIGKAVRQIVETQQRELSSVRDQVGAVASQSDEARVAAEMAALDERHPDWRQIAVDPEFAGWAASQPPAVQAMATSWSASEVSAALDLYRVQSGKAAPAPPPPPSPPPPGGPQEQQQGGAPAKTDARRRDQLDGGADVRSRPAPAASGPPDDFEAAFEHFAARRMEAMRRPVTQSR